VNLTVHHIKPVRLAPDLALDPDNLVTLCRSCHGRREARGV
jgi:5-methylcytosine-specific restriction endonuclease McrA